MKNSTDLVKVSLFVVYYNKQREVGLSRFCSATFYHLQDFEQFFYQRATSSNFSEN